MTHKNHLSIANQYKNIPKAYQKYYEEGSRIIASQEKPPTNHRKETAITLICGLSISLTILLCALFFL